MFVFGNWIFQRKNTRSFQYGLFSLILLELGIFFGMF